MQYESLLRISPLTKKQRIDTAIFTLKGILQGIAIDGVIETLEAIELKKWLRDVQDLINVHPFSEFIPKLKEALDRGIESEDYEDILWVCKSFDPEGSYYDAVTTDIQTLHGILHGILADGKITESELNGLRMWMERKEDLKGLFPYDEIKTLVTQVMMDGVIDPAEQSMLKMYFEQFVRYSLATQFKQNRGGQLAEIPLLHGICATQPDIAFEGKTYCFTGASKKATRATIARIVEQLGGIFSGLVTKDLNYLVVGNEGNPAWAMTCYGRKIEQAMNLRKLGTGIIILHENDFWDSALDYGVKAESQ